MCSNCPFCFQRIKSQVVDGFGTVVAIKDRFPVSQGHLLIIPKRHTRDYFSMTSSERHDAEVLIQQLRRKILQADATVSGFNVGANCGLSAGQTVFHAHLHLIPRRDGDTADPRGGVRGVIPGKMSY